MRTNEERIAAMHRRADELDLRRRERVARIAGVMSFVLCFSAVLALALSMPALADGGTIGQGSGGLYASLLIRSGVLSYVVTGIVAFLLGMSVTVFCFCLKKWQDRGGPGKQS